MALEIGGGITIGGNITVTIETSGANAPGAPTIGTATATGATTATVAFTAPGSDGGATITSYTATSSPGNITGILSQAGSGTITVTGLSQGTNYTFTVTATNAAGTSSPSSASNSITTFATPVNTVAPVVSGTATVGQTLSSTTGTWTGTATITYTYQWQRNGVDIGSATSSTYTLVNADAGNPVRCVVTGTNSYGNSSANSNATSNVAAIAPGAPTIGTATVTGTTTATVAFTAPASNGGATITSYTATSSPGGITGTLSQAGSGTINMTGLTQGTSYTFTVTATNSAGTGSASSASNSITTYSSPANTVAPVVSGTATVGQVLSTTNGTWTGTATITYTYQWQRNGVDIGSATSSTYTLVNADAGNPVRCVVTGTNSYGNSSANSNATANVAAIAPGAPTIGTATATGTTTATVAFTAPASNGGATITTYTATSSPGNITGTLSQAGSGTISVTGLTQGTSYTFTVTATNSAGTGSASSASNSITTFATPVNTVAPVVSGTATVGQVLSTTNGTWTGTATITYTYQWQRNSVDIGSATSSTYTLVDADAGNPIRCVVTGTNSYGNSSANSNATSNVSAIVPGAPTISTATATGDTTATVAFTAPASNGGATITSYTATSSPAGGTGTLSQAGSGTISVTGLTQGTTYTFTVTATNSVGTGSASAASNSITTTASYFNYNTLLLPGASTTFVDDASTNNFAVTINGDTKPNSLNPYSPGYYSNFFQAGAGYTSGNGLSVAANSAFAFGTGDFTVEFWTRPPAFGDGNSTAPTMVAVHNGATDSGWQLFWNGLAIGIRTYYSNVVAWSNDMTPYLNQWSHIAYVRYNGTQKIYINGQEKCSTATVWNWTDNTVGIAQTAQYYTGNISNLRMIKGTALYTSNFTPPTGPLTAVSGTSLLTCQSNRFIDNSTNNFAITLVNSPTISSAQPFTPNSSYSTYGSGYLNGTTDYLTVPQNAAFNFGTGDFTVEGWWNFTSIAADQCLVMLGTGANVPNPKCAWWLRYQSSGTLSFYRYDGAVTENNFTLPSALNTNTWYHIACTRSGTSLKMFVNGVAVGTTITSSLNFDNVDSDPLVIGRVITGGGTYYANGYYSDVRIVKGTAVYTTAFTPPTSPLTAISGTSLLTLQNNQSVNNNVFLDNSSNNLLVTRNGNTTQGTFSPYGGNWSNYFDATYIQTPAGSTTAIIGGTGAITPTSTFTVECWIYQTQRHTGASQPVLIGDQGTNGSLYWTFGPDTTGKLAFYVYTGSQVLSTGNDTIPLNTWTHIAMSINSGAIKLFVNGNLQTITGATTTGTQTGTFGYLLTGGFYTFTGGYAYIGYLSNLRIVKSALYTTTFTPSTTPLTPVTNTGLLTCQSSSFIDNSLNKFALTTGSTLSVQRFSPFNPSSLTPTSYSGYFDGTGDYLTVPFNSAFNLGSGDFTIEFWVNTTSTAAYATALRLGDTWTTGSWALYLNDSGGSGIPSWWSQTLSNTLTSSGATINDGAWHHIALVRNSATMTMYIDGTSRGTLSVSTSSIGDTSTSLWIARDSSNVRELAGYLSNIRIVKGTALYTSNFTPSTTPLTTTSQGATASQVSLLTLQSSTFIDNSTNNFTISAFGNSQPLTQNPFGYTSATTQGYTVSTIGGSGYFDGTGDYLTVPYTSGAFNYYTNNFCIELFAYVTANPQIYQIMVGQETNQGRFWLGLDTGKLWFQFQYGTGITDSVAVPLNQWVHVKAQRVSGVNYLYKNGTLVGTASETRSFTATSNLYIGTDSNGTTQTMVGNLSDVRVINGGSFYVGNFVPPSAPSTAVQNTTFLSNMTSGGIIDYTMMTNSETVGNASLSTTVTKFGATSLYFDGTGDWLLGPTTSTNKLLGNFTIELWVYVAAWSANMGGMVAINNIVGSGYDGLSIYFDTSNRINFWVNGNSAAVATTTATYSLSTWYHIALVRSGATNTLYVDGIASASNNATPTWPDTGLAIGVGRTYNDYAGAGYSLNGYIDDLRISRYAVYTSNFTPPSAPFPTY